MDPHPPVTGATRLHTQNSVRQQRIQARGLARGLCRQSKLFSRKDNGRSREGQRRLDEKTGQTHGRIPR